MEKVKTILIIGANDRAAYSVARQYSLNNYYVVICNWEDHPIKHSKYVNQFLLFSDLERDFNLFIEDVENYLKNNIVYCVSPINDTAIIVCHYLKKKNSDLIFLNINDDDTIKYASNKYQLILKCQELLIPIPKTKYISNLKDLDFFLENNNENLCYPLIIKPVESKKLFENKIFSNVVKKVYNRTQLINSVRELIHIVPVMIQEKITGHGVGFNLIAEKGKIVDYYMHERINEQWGGGESSYRKTILNDKYNLHNYVKKLIENIKWTGVCMIEFIINDNKAYVMEINGRFWGSIELGIFAGKNFPLMQIELISHNRLINTSKLNKVYFSRNLINDFRWAFIGLTKHKRFLNFIKWFLNLYKSLRKNEIVEDSFFRDFKFRSSILISFWIKFYNKLIRILALIFFRYPRAQLNKIPEKSNIAFICKGNICRSSFAEHYSKINFQNYNFFSAGTIKQNNRYVPIFALDAALKFHINMSNHLSKNIKDIEDIKIDFFIIMDKENYYDLIRQYKINKNKIIFLSNKKSISDPYNESLDNFILTYQRISKELDLLFRM